MKSFNTFFIKQVMFIILTCISFTTIGCSFYESQGRKDFEDARDFQVVITSFDEKKNPIELLLSCQNTNPNELLPQLDSTENCGFFKTENQQIFFYKKLSEDHLQKCSPVKSDSPLTLDQLSFCKNTFCELDNH